MSSLQQLQSHHTRYSHCSQFRLQLHLNAINHSLSDFSSQRILMDQLMSRLLKLSYIQAYSWVVNDSPKTGKYIDCLFYLDHFTHEGLVIMVIEAYQKANPSWKMNVIECDWVPDVVLAQTRYCKDDKSMQNSTMYHYEGK